MHRKSGKNRDLVQRAALEALQSRLMLSADAEGVIDERVELDGEVIEAEILPLEEGEAIPEEWYRLEVVDGDGEVVADGGEFEILILEEGGEGEPREGGEVIGDDEIFYTMGEVLEEDGGAVIEDGGPRPEEESPVVGEGVEGEVIITMVPEGSEGEPLPDEELPPETVWLTNVGECAVNVTAPTNDEMPENFIGLAPIVSEEPSPKPGADARWAPPEGEELPDDFVPPDDTLGEDEPTDGEGAAGIELALPAPDQLLDGSVFGDVAIEDDVLGTDTDILA